MNKRNTCLVYHYVYINTQTNIMSGIQTTIWIPDQYSNGDLYIVLPIEYRTSEYRTSKSLLFRSFCYSDVPFSDPHCITGWFATK